MPCWYFDAIAKTKFIFLHVSISVSNHTIFTLQGPRLEISDFREEEWVSRTCFRASVNKLYIACDNGVYIHDYTSGQRLDSLPNLHELTITCMAIHEPNDFLITGSKDGASTSSLRSSDFYSFIFKSSYITHLTFFPILRWRSQSME
jgi:hypothetical protein